MSATASQTPTLLTSDQAAAILQVAPQTMANWRMQGRGPRCIRLGRMIRYRLVDIEKWIAEQSN